MAKVELVLNKQTGEWEEREVGANGASVKPRRSWVQGGQEGAYDFKFESVEDGATIYCKYAADIEGLKATQAQTTEEATTLKTKAEAFIGLQNDRESQVTPERIKELEKELTIEASKLKINSIAFARSLVKECVIDWKSGPVAFSPEIRDNLPSGICMEWMAEIINRHDLTEDDSAFLKTGSATSSPGENPIG